MLTRDQIAADLRVLGVHPGHTLLVHSSLKSIGYVPGGAPTVVEAMRAAVGETGNIVVPASTEANSLTSRAYRDRIAGLSAAEVKRYRDRMPAFDPALTPSNAGKIAEAVRTAAGAFRSEHPQSSFAAIGPDAPYLMADHRLECHLGEESPLGKLYKMPGVFVLLLGVGYEACTAFHLAEYRYTPSPPELTYECVVATGSGSRWARYQDVVLDDRQFGAVGDYVDSVLFPSKGYIGKAMCCLFPLGDAVDFATKWMKNNRR